MKTAGLHMVALFAVPLAGGRWGRFVAAADRLPIRPFWEECFSYEDYLGNAKPSTLELCRKLGVDVLFLVHVQRGARGKLFRERMEELSQ
jgi:hypothetical protein